MAYKPPKQTIADNDLKGFPSNEAVFEALKLKLDEPTVNGTNGQLLQLDGYVLGEAVTSWVNPPSSGANTTLSNLTAPTAVNQNLNIQITNPPRARVTSQQDSSTATGVNAVTPSNSGTTSLTMSSSVTNILQIGDIIYLNGLNKTLSQVLTIAGNGLSITVTQPLGAGGGGTSREIYVVPTAYSFRSPNGTPGLSLFNYFTDVGNNYVTHLHTNTPGLIIGSFRGALRGETAEPNIFIGYNSGIGANQNYNNVVIGGNTTVASASGNCIILGNNTSVSQNSIGIGVSVTANAGQGNIAVGGSSTAASNGTAVGFSANSSGSSGVAIGYGSATGSGADNTVVGQGAGRSASSGANNTIIGRTAAIALTTAADNVIVGKSAGSGITSASNCILIGNNTGSSITTNGSHIVIGHNANSSNTAFGLNLVIGTGASASADSNTVLGHNASSTNNSVVIGYLASVSGVNSGESICIGLSSTSNGKYNTLLGIGTKAVGDSNTVMGYYAQRLATIAATENVSIGRQAGENLQSAQNVLVGRSAGIALTTGAKNLFLGYTAGDAVTTGSNNVIIGDIAGSTTLADTVIVAAGTAERFRVDSSGNMGIGTTTPGQKLDVNGSIQATNGDLIAATAGKGLSIKSGTNAKIGTATFTAQSSITVNTTAVTANSLIFVTGQDGIDAFCVGNKVASTGPGTGSFDIVHSTGNVTAVVAWMIVEATP